MKGYVYQSDFAKKHVAEGRLQGQRSMLLIVLRARFGELPASAVARVESAEVSVVEQWADRLLAAETLAAVLDDPS